MEEMRPSLPNWDYKAEEAEKAIKVSAESVWSGIRDSGLIAY